jgi:hypothetical protein
VRLDDATSTALRFAPSSANAQIHRFDTPLRGQPRYIASGEIAGSLLNQFSMDEKDGLLRVASTTEGQNQRVFPIDEPAETVKPAKPAESEESAVSNSATTENGVTADTPVSSTGVTGGGSTGSTGPAAEPGSDGAVTDAAKPAPGLSLPPTRPAVAPKEKPSDGRVTVLKVDGDELAEVGVIKGLGVGERIRGVRFIGDVGYVVTYRQTDPLYTVDLSDPAHPKVRGELSVLGYSAYLHPAGDGRLLGLGQDGTKEGASTGLQLSLFDVSNLDAPRRLDRTRMAGAWSDVEADHHAFTMAGDLVLVPYYAWTSVEVKGSSDVPPNETYVSTYDGGVIAVRVGPDGLGAPTTLRPIADGPIDFPQSGNVPKKVSRITDATPLRTLVHDGTIYTLTPTGVAAHSGTSLDRLTFAEF